MNRLTVLISFFMLLTFHSCSNEDAQMYSCSPDVDKWAKTNLKEIRQLTRGEWLKMKNQAYQKAAYAAFTKTQKLNFWTYKLDDVLRLDWNSQEIDHLRKIADFIQNNPDVFRDDYSEEDKKKFDIFVYQWIEDAIKKSKWSEQLVANLIMTGYPVLDIKGTLQMPQKGNSIKTRSEIKCDCHVGNVAFISCPGAPDYCSSHYTCDKEIDGCGAFWSESCNGLCD